MTPVDGMEISAQHVDGKLVVAASGRIDGVNASDFEASVLDASGEGDGAVVVNLRELSYISSAGLRALLLIAKALAARQAQFAICELSMPIREVFTISGFDKVIAVHDSQAAALDAVGGGA